MKRKRMLQPVLSLLVVFLLILSLWGGVSAAGGNGSGGGNGDGSGSSTAETTVVDTPAVVTTDPGLGDGSGGGKEDPLALATANPALNATDISVDAPITLEFNKNIAYTTVRDGNLKAFTLWESNTQIPVDVTMADDQLEPDLRNFVTITPKTPLAEGTTYTLKADNTLVAKSGAALSAPLEMSFTTTAPAATVFSNSTIILFIGLGVILIIVIAVLVMKRKKA
ncbi:MAG: Ig-like domain-containing protein [Acetobacterium sp.]